MPVVPYAAVAGLLPEEEGTEEHAVLEGRAFCFLPITSTGLPVHVNGVPTALTL